jgi:hypothetical protein
MHHLLYDRIVQWVTLAGADHPLNSALAFLSSRADVAALVSATPPVASAPSQHDLTTTLELKVALRFTEITRAQELILGRRPVIAVCLHCLISAAQHCQLLANGWLLRRTPQGVYTNGAIFRLSVLLRLGLCPALGGDTPRKHWIGGNSGQNGPLDISYIRLFSFTSDARNGLHDTMAQAATSFFSTPAIPRLAVLGFRV